MALIPYSHRTPSHTSRASFYSSSGHSTSSPHRPSSTRSSTSSRFSRTSSASSVGSSYTGISTQTFGTSSRPGYVPGQAPHDYFYNDAVREEWDNAPVDASGRRVRATSGRGRQSTRHGGLSSSGSNVEFEKGGRFLGSGQWEDEDDRDNDTVCPSDSISQVSFQPSRAYSRRSEGEGMRSSREYYPPSNYSGGFNRGNARSEGVGRSPGGSWTGNDMVSVANGRLVRIEEPDW